MLGNERFNLWYYEASSFLKQIFENKEIEILLSE